MNPLELSDRLREDYRRFTWTTYPIADAGLRERLEHLVDTEALLWRGPYLSVQPRFQLDATLADLAARIGLPAEIVRGVPAGGPAFRAPSEGNHPDQRRPGHPGGHRHRVGEDGGIPGPGGRARLPAAAPSRCQGDRAVPDERPGQ